MSKTLPSDYFNNRSGEKDELYRQIVDEIITELDKDKPNTMVAVRQMVDNLRNPNSFYGLLVGEIQAGKTPAQMILTWIFSRHPEFRGSVCFVTKNLDAIRRDIMGKFKSDLINRHIVTVCKRHGIKAIDAVNQFGLTYHIYTDHKTDQLGLAGQVEIMLMQKDNFSHIRRWYSELNKFARAAPILFLVDEMHEMYAGSNDLIENNGLTDATKIGNAGMLHWFQKKSLERRCYLIGVTATPYAPLSADPVCWPTRVYNLKTDAPSPGLTYYGYIDHQLCKDIKIDTFDPNITVDLKIIDNIIRRPRKTLANGNTEVTFMCLTNLTYNKGQEDAANIIKHKYKDSVDVLVFNQENDIPLNEWFRKEMLTKKVCQSGAIVIIGRACMAAGITIKPAKPLLAEHDGVTYQVTGITDQFMPNSSNLNLTSMKQLMRILGWFPVGHAANLWLPSEKLHAVYRSEFGYVSLQFMEKYDPSIGSTSVNEIDLPSPHIKKFYNDHVYAGDQHYGCHLYDNISHPHLFPNDGTELEIMYKPVNIDALAREGIDPERTIASFYALAKEQHRLHSACGFKKGGGGLFQIAYKQDRYEEIIKAALQPREHDKRLHVNAFLWGAQGHLSKLKDCQIGIFKTNWDVREKGEQTYFKTPDGRLNFIKKAKSVVHKYSKEFCRIQTTNKNYSNSFSDEHHKILKKLDDMSVELKEKDPIKPWALFVKCYKLVYGVGSPTKCSEPYKIFKDQFTYICALKTNDQNKLNAGIECLRA
jgi:hypothetical protein